MDMVNVKQKTWDKRKCGGLCFFLFFFLFLFCFCFCFLFFFVFLLLFFVSIELLFGSCHSIYHK